MKNISLRNTIMTDNYDLNIWDRRGYETEYAEEGWAIDIYAYKHVQDPYGSGRHMKDHTISHTPTPATLNLTCLLASAPSANTF